MEEHVPGTLTQKSKSYAGVSVNGDSASDERRSPSNGQVSTPPSCAAARHLSRSARPRRKNCKRRLDAALKRVQSGWTPPVAFPNPLDLRAQRTPRDRLRRSRRTAGAAANRQQSHELRQPAGMEGDAAAGDFPGQRPSPARSPSCSPVRAASMSTWGAIWRSVSPLVAEVFAEADARHDADPRQAADLVYLRRCRRSVRADAGRIRSDADGDHPARHADARHRDLPPAGRLRLQAGYGHGALARRICRADRRRDHAVCRRARSRRRARQRDEQGQHGRQRPDGGGDRAD